MKKIKQVFCNIFVGMLSIVCWQPSIANQDTLNIIKNIQRYTIEASTLSPQDVYQELERLRIIQTAKYKNTSHPDLIGDDNLKSAGYAASLEERRKRREPVASLYWGNYNSRLCSVLDLNKTIGDAAKKCWADTLESFQIGSNSGIAMSSLAIGQMYENGLGVVASKFVAADYFIKATEQHQKTGSREGALVSLEAALRVVPDHPSALRLKAELLK